MQPVYDDIHLELSLYKHINQFMVQDIKLPLKDIKIYEIICHTIPIQNQQAGTKAPKQLTEFNRLNIKNLDQLNRLRGRIAGVMMPKDLA